MAAALAAAGFFAQVPAVRADTLQGVAEEAMTALPAPAVAPASGATGSTVPGSSVEAIERALIERVNADGAKHGLAPVAADPELVETARQRAAAQTALSHYDSSGKLALMELFRGGAVPYWLAGEKPGAADGGGRAGGGAGGGGADEQPDTPEEHPGAGVQPPGGGDGAGRGWADRICTDLPGGVRDGLSCLPFPLGSRAKVVGDNGAITAPPGARGCRSHLQGGTGLRA